MSVSKDNKKFIDVAKQKSSGNTNGIESYSLKEVDARYARITVTKNTENNFASIVEIAIGSKKSSNPSPPPSSDKCDSKHKLFGSIRSYDKIFLGVSKQFLPCEDSTEGED